MKNPPSPSRLRPAIAGLWRVEKLWRANVDPPLPRLRRAGFVEYFFFIIGIWVCVSAFSRSRDAVCLALRGVDALDSRNLRCREGRSSCWAEFGQAFSMLNGKLPAATPVAARGSSVPLHKCISPSRSYPGLNSDARRRRTPKAIRARSTAHPFRPAVDGLGVRAPSGRAVRYPLTRSTLGTGEVKSCRRSHSASPTG